MSNIKFSQDLFLEVQELNRFQDFLTYYEGGSKNLLKNLTYTPGIIKLKGDPTFNNFKIEAGTNPQTIKLGQDSIALDEDLNLIFKEAQDNINIPLDGFWYWVKIAYKPTPVEVGYCSIDTSGNLTGVNTKFLDVLRGGTDYPVRVKFYNSTQNFEPFGYEVAAVTDNFNAILAGDFIAEQNIRYSVIGAFTDGFVPSSTDAEIYQYDGCLSFNFVEALVKEINPGVQPPLNTGTEFFIARVKAQGTNGILIEDKRTDFWQTKAEYDATYLDKVNINQVVGIEDIRFSSITSPKNQNEVNLAWGLRTTNWTIDSSLRKIAVADGIGGRFKSAAAFTTGDFDGWRVYSQNGGYKTIAQSIKSGSQINLILESLDPSDYTANDELYIVPNAEEIEFTFESEVEVSNCKVTFPISDSNNKVYLEVPTADPAFQYEVKFRLKNGSNYSDWTLIPDDTTIGYLTEASFGDNGVIKATADQVRQTYTLGLITLVPNPNNFYLFTNKVDKGDIRGVFVQTNTPATNIFTLKPAVSKTYLLFKGTLNLTADLIIDLVTVGAVEDNYFTIQFDCDNVILNGYKIKIAQNFTGGGSVLRELDFGDFFVMKNIDKGIVFNARFDSLNWFLSQNYELGMSRETKMLTNQLLLANFDPISKMGIKKGYFGWAWADGGNYAVNSTTIQNDNLTKMFIVGYDPSNTDYSPVGKEGGEEKHSLTEDENGPHTHTYNVRVFAGGTYPNTTDNANSTSDNQKTTGSSGLGAPHENRPQYYTVLFIQRLF